ncbi:hypothetical protein TrCOL_g12390 [Triparma columacea]|uniref:Uncharacterized protein n=1 Tax=Triparma columacea TaxID=722753 RepID=A0A9W7L444_9STRA|nr:hypothetical protein TrCOL_g12390 [Triparma columacea]
MIACNITGVVRVYFESGEVQNQGGRITVDAGGECYEWLREWFRKGGRGVMVTYEGHSGCAVGAGEKGGVVFLDPKAGVGGIEKVLGGGGKGKINRWMGVTVGREDMRRRKKWEVVAVRGGMEGWEKGWRRLMEGKAGK